MNIKNRFIVLTIAQWLTEHEEKVEQVAFQNHMGTK